MGEGGSTIIFRAISAKLRDSAQYILLKSWVALSSQDCLFVRSWGIGDIPLYLHVLMVWTMQTIYFLKAYEPHYTLMSLWWQWQWQRHTQRQRQRQNEKKRLDMCYIFEKDITQGHQILQWWVRWMMMLSRWCTAGDAPQVMHCRWCIVGDVHRVMYHRWCTEGNVQ